MFFCFRVFRFLCVFVCVFRFFSVFRLKKKVSFLICVFNVSSFVSLCFFFIFCNEKCFYVCFVFFRVPSF